MTKTLNVQYVMTRLRSRRQRRKNFTHIFAIPRPLINTILANAHNSPVSGGHYGIARTIDKMRGPHMHLM
jgi:hypothetical protein